MDECQEIARWIVESFDSDEVPAKLIVAKLNRFERLAKECGTPLEPEFAQYLVQIRKEMGKLNAYEGNILKGVKRFVDTLWEEMGRVERIPQNPHLCQNCGRR